MFPRQRWPAHLNDEPEDFPSTQKEPMLNFIRTVVVFILTFIFVFAASGCNSRAAGTQATSPPAAEASGAQQGPGASGGTASAPLVRPAREGV